jgi:hypothetical protein
MDFFGKILHCYDCALSLLWRTQTIFLIDMRKELLGAIKILTSLWPAQRMWEKDAASVTPKLHDLWFELPEQLTYLGHFYHFMKDPIKNLHKINRLMDAVYCHLQDCEFREESKRRQEESIGKNSLVKIQMQQVMQSRKQKFAAATLLKKEQKMKALTTIKKERRNLP